MSEKCNRELGNFYFSVLLKWQTWEGDHVRVTTGPMRGTEGYVKRDGGRMLLYLNVEILGSSVEVAIPPSDVERV